MATQTKNTKYVRVQNAAAAGTSNLVGSTVDCQGFENVIFVYGLNTLTATQNTKLKAGGGAQSNGSDATDLAGTGTPQGAFVADTDSNKIIVLELANVQQRYITPTLVRGTANAAVDFGIAVLWNNHKGNVAQDVGNTLATAAYNAVTGALPGTAG